MEPEEPIPRYCSYCGNPFVPGAKFCHTCGQQMLMPSQLVFNWRRILSVASNRFLQPIIRVFLPLIVLSLAVIYGFQFLRILFTDTLLPFDNLELILINPPPPNLALSLILSNIILLLEGASTYILTLLIAAMAYLILMGEPTSFQTSVQTLSRRWRPFTIVFLILNIPSIMMVNYAYFALHGYLPAFPLFTPSLPLLFASLPFLIIGIPVLFIILVYIGLGLSLYQPILLFEDTGIIMSLKTSWHRMAGRRWSVFAATFLISLLFVIPQSFLLPYSLSIPILDDLLTPLITVASTLTNTIINTTIYYLLISSSTTK